MFKSYGKVFVLLLVMLIGAFLPQFHTLSFLMQYLLMAMLFFAFLDLDFQPQMFQGGVVWVWLANLLIAFLSYWLVSFFDLTLALAAFMTAIAPTAISGPVIISFIEGRVEYMVASVLLTNLSMALIVPVALPFLMGAAVNISVWDVLQPVLIVTFVPLILARLVRRLPAPAQSVVRKGKRFSFALWLFNLFIIASKTSDFLLNEHGTSLNALVAVALISLVICIVNFTLGAWLGGAKYWQESSQALGQKNNSVVIWIALTFINPLVAMGPTCYVLYHNLYNSWQIYRFEKRRKGG